MRAHLKPPGWLSDLRRLLTGKFFKIGNLFFHHKEHFLQLLTSLTLDTYTTDNTALELLTIGHFLDGVILLKPPEFISFSFSDSNFVIQVDSKEQ